MMKYLIILFFALSWPVIPKAQPLGKFSVQKIIHSNNNELLSNKILSLPYALHAKTTESVIGTIPETDPIYKASVASEIKKADTSYWNQKQNMEIILYLINQYRLKEGNGVPKK